MAVFILWTQMPHLAAARQLQQRPDFPDVDVQRDVVYKKIAIAASPISYVSKDDAAFLIIHGENDMSIPVSQSEAFGDKLKAAGVDARLEVAKGRGHGVGGPNFASEIISFFDKHL